MSAWPSTCARRVLAALLRIGLVVYRQVGLPMLRTSAPGAYTSAMSKRGLDIASLTPEERPNLRQWSLKQIIVVLEQPEAFPVLHRSGCKQTSSSNEGPPTKARIAGTLASGMGPMVVASG
jgi:hypothetical protein